MLDRDYGVVSAQEGRLTLWGCSRLLPEQAFGEKERQNQAPRVRGLKVRKSSQQVRVECEERSRDESAGKGCRPLVNDPPPGERRRRKAGDEQEIEGQHGRPAHPPDRRAGERRDDERLRVGKSTVVGLKDVARKEARGFVGDRVSDPTHDPGVQLGVSVVVQGGSGRSDGDRPRMEDGQRQAEKGGDSDARHPGGGRRPGDEHSRGSLPPFLASSSNHRRTGCHGAVGPRLTVRRLTATVATPYSCGESWRHS